ncbi:uncharacterized protein [Choristoneura fumiferana]|uniref:uncharacterized protein n=1 Tax=Choristoneura fumiferana TaxID=7141 RepID=UPI003D15C2AD
MKPQSGILFVLSFIEITSPFNVPFDRKKYQYDLRLAPLLFKDWMIEHNKNYTGEEKEYRFKIFSDNLKRINAINQNFKGPWLAQLSDLSDLTYLDFAKLKNLTEEDFLADLSKDRKVINCTDRRTYLIERFATPKPASDEE